MFLKKTKNKQTQINLPSASSETEPESVWLRLLLFVLEVIAICLIVLFILRLLVLHPYTVIGVSMYPTLEEKDEVYVNALSYAFRDPERGDIVVLIPPHDTDKFYVKRIIGLPGDKVEIRGDGQVIIYNDRYPSGISLREEYLRENYSTNGYVVEKLRDDEYFVMGDNREHSSDSRGSMQNANAMNTGDWTLPKKNIVGKVVYRLNPLIFFRRPDYNL